MTWREEAIISDRDVREGTCMMHTTMVEGHSYKFWAVPILRGTFAENENGEIKQIHWNGYITNDLTARKAIMVKYGHKSFKKNAR